MDSLLSNRSMILNPKYGIIGMVDAGLLKPANRALIYVCAAPGEALDRLRAVEPTYVETWIEPEDR